jgi:LysR family transcriptional regulator, glycine cleavage system transcriptional activator
MIRLPPLNALRAFEAVSRLRSMKAAAGELNVTPGAVSQLVRRLEDSLGVKLFRRLNRTLVPTELGHEYFLSLRGAFRQIGDATRRLDTAAAAGALTISAPPAFAASWLVPRLGRFRERHPAINLRIVTTRALADFRTDGVDVAIRHGLGRYRALRSDRVAGIDLIPVCSPGFLAAIGAAGLLAGRDLARLPLLHDGERQEWALWFQAQGIDDVARDVAAGPSFDDQMLLIRAAATGQGIALVTEALVRSELACGTLVRAVDSAWPQEFAYWLVCPEETAKQPKIAAFRGWLIAEAAGGGSED